MGSENLSLTVGTELSAHKNFNFPVMDEGLKGEKCHMMRFKGY